MSTRMCSECGREFRVESQSFECESDKNAYFCSLTCAEDHKQKTGHIVKNA